MTLVISPEPSDDERTAILIALEQLRGTVPANPWWRRGIEDALGAEIDEERA